MTTHRPINPEATNYGSTSDLERVPEGQPGEHPHQGVPGHRIERDDLVQPAPRGVPDTDPAEALVPAVQSRGAEFGDRQGLRVREGTLRRLVGGRLRKGASRVDPRDRPRAVRG